ITSDKNGDPTRLQACLLTRADRKRLRVLIAEEESLSRSLLKSSLSYWCCEVRSVRSGEEAKTALLAGNVDVCILNWEISDLNALDMCRWIRQANLRTEPHII